MFVKSHMELLHIPAASEEATPMARDTATTLEKEIFLKDIVDTVSSQFPELSFLTGYNALDSNNPI